VIITFHVNAVIRWLSW